MTEYVITAIKKGSNEAYLTAIIENVAGGHIVKSIIQNTKVSDEINVDHIKKFLAHINSCDVTELPPLDKFISTNVFLLEAKEKIDSNFTLIID